MTFPRILGDGYPPIPVVAADPDEAPELLGGLVPLDVPDPVKDGEDGADRAGLPSASRSSNKSEKS